MHATAHASEFISASGIRVVGGRDEDKSMLHDLTLPCSSKDFGCIILPMFGRELA
jgi:hypothetical protein